MAMGAFARWITDPIRELGRVERHLGVLRAELIRAEGESPPALLAHARNPRLLLDVAPEQGCDQSPLERQHLSGLRRRESWLGQRREIRVALRFDDDRV